MKVVVRCRPMNKREMSLKCAVSVQVHEDIGKIELQKPVDGQITRLDTSKPAKAFTYDAVYGANAIQRSVFMDTGFPLVQSVLEGYNGTVFAYGQTGCGKSKPKASHAYRFDYLPQYDSQAIPCKGLTIRLSYVV